MSKLVIGAALVWPILGATAWAQAPAARDDAVTRAERAAQEARYWAEEAARAVHDDPRQLIRQRAAYEAANRTMRIEGRKWTNRSLARPTIIEPTAGWPITPTSPTWYNFYHMWPNNGYVQYGWYPGGGMISAYQWGSVRQFGAAAPY